MSPKKKSEWIVLPIPESELNKVLFRAERPVGRDLIVVDGNGVARLGKGVTAEEALPVLLAIVGSTAKLWTAVGGAAETIHREADAASAMLREALAKVPAKAPKKRARR